LSIRINRLRFTTLAPLSCLLLTIVVPEAPLGSFCQALILEVSRAAACRIKESEIHDLTHVLIGRQVRRPLEIHLQHGLLV
jgi:hypothetical protein